jgi:hypothetical protein
VVFAVWAMTMGLGGLIFGLAMLYVAWKNR